MNPSNVKLSGQAILEKEFKTGMRGYNQDEVDEFLDVIIKDYEALQQQIEKLSLENDRLKKSTDQSKTRVSQPAQSTQPTQPVNQVNYDVLKRLSNLEKEVFGKKFNES